FSIHHTSTTESFTLALHDALPILDLGQRSGTDALVHNAIAALAPRARQGVTSPAEFIRLADVVNEMRLHKSPAELELMRKASDIDRKSTRLNSSHVSISYAVFCLK